MVLLKLNKTVPFELTNHTINSVCLPTLEILEKNIFNQCIVIGWGNEQKDGYSSYNLREVRLPIVSKEECFATHRFKYDANTQICAGGVPEGGKGACFG